jgi:AbiV family abortive infection protein
MAISDAGASQQTLSSLDASIRSCVENGERLLDDAMWLEHQNPPATKLVLSVIAQEEFAKAFLLILVRQNVIPWSPQLLRAMNDHACKQLVGVILNYIDPYWETIEELKAIVAEDAALGDLLPYSVASAINILRHEKIRRWESANWVWAEDPEYDPVVQRIADGKRDRLKQDALYVRIARDGRVASAPTSVTEASVDVEYDRAKRYHLFLTFLLDGREKDSTRYKKICATLKALFET